MLDELRETGDLGVGERVELAAEERIETRGRRELALEGPHRPAEVVVREGILGSRERPGEERRVARNRPQHGQHVVGVGHRHLDRVQHGALGLFLDVGGATVPELGDVEGGVVDARRVAGAALSLVSGRSRFVVDAELVELVTGVAGDLLALRNPRIEIEQAPEFHLRVGDRIGRVRRLRRQHTKDLPGALSQRLARLGARTARRREPDQRDAADSNPETPLHILSVTSCGERGRSSK